MTKKPKLPAAEFREWASMLLHIESLADAACYTVGGSFEQTKLLKQLVMETQILRAKFVRRMEKAT